jgi:hypothetical protein
MRLLHALVIATAAAVLGAAPSRARADSEGALAWGFLAGEASTAGVFALNFGVRGWPNKGPALALNFTPMVLGPGIGAAAHYGGLDPRPAYAIHGAGAMGFDLFLVGGLIDGRSDRDGFRVGTAAWTLGAVGAGFGAWIGASEIDNADEGAAFYVAPIGGFVAGGLVIGGISALVTRDSNKAMRGFIMGAAIGLSAGLAGSTVFAFMDRSGTRDEKSSARTVLHPSAETVTNLLSVSGAF